MSGGADLFTVLSQTESGRMLAADTRPAVVVDRSGTRLLWANAAGAAFFGVDTVDKLTALRFAAGSPFARRIAALDDTLTSGQDRIERLPLQRGFLPRPTVCKASRVAVDGIKAILLTIVDGTGSLSGDPATAFAAFAATARPASALAAPVEGAPVGEIAPEQDEAVEAAAEDVLSESEAIKEAEPEEAAEAVAAEAVPEPDHAAEEIASEPEAAAGEVAAEPEEIGEAAAEETTPEPEEAAPEPAETTEEIAAEPEGTAEAVAEEIAPKPEATAGEVAAEPEEIGEAAAEETTPEPEEAAPEPAETTEEIAAEPKGTAEAVAEEIVAEPEAAAEQVTTEPEGVVEAAAEADVPELEDAAPALEEIIEEIAAEPEGTAEAVAEDIVPEPEEAIDEVPAEPEEAVEAAAEEAAPEQAAPEPAAPLFSFPRHGRAVRFVFELDPLLAFTFVSSDLAETVGPGMSDIIGRTWSEVAGRLEFDPAGRVAEALGRRDTFTGLTVDWPVEGECLRVPSDLAGMPVFGRERTFLGYRGFGVLKTGAAFDAPVPAEPIAASEPDAPIPAVPIAAEKPETTAEIGAEATEETPPVADTSEAAPEELTAVDEPVAVEMETAAEADLPPPADIAIEAPAEPIAASEPDTPIPVVPIASEKPETTAEIGAEATGETLPVKAVEEFPEAALEEQTPVDEPAEDIAEVVGEPAETEATVEIEAAPEEPTSIDEPVAVEMEAAAETDLLPPADIAIEAPAEDVAELVEEPANVEAAVDTEVAFDEPTSIDEPVVDEPETLTAPDKPVPADVIESVAAEETTDEGPDAPAEIVEDVAVEEPVAEQPEIPVEIEAVADILELTEAEESAAEGQEAPAEVAAEPEPPAPPVAAEPEPPAPPRTAFASLSDDKARGLSKPERDAFDKIAEALADAFGPRIGADPTDRSVIARPRVIETPPGAGPSIDIALLDKLPVALAILRDGDIIHANRAFLDLSGYPDVATIEADGGFAQVFEGAALNRNAAIPTVRRRDGVEIPVSARLHSMPMAGGIASLLVVQETAATTSRDRLATAEQRVEDMEAILDTATDGVLVLDQKSLVIGANKSAEALFGNERSQMIGMAFVDLLAPESHRSALDYLDGLSRNALSSVLNDGREVIGRVAGGGLVPLFMTVGRVSPTKFCAVLRDITQWKRAEEELTSAKKAAENASSQKSDFLAKMSHEIRTPLNAIIGFSEVMMEERFGPVGNERYKEYLRDIHVSGTHIMSLVNDLLDLSKIEAGKLELTFEAVGLNDVVRECAALMQPQANRERIIIRTSLSSSLPPVVADSRSLRQIVLNLLSNAVKFNTAGGQVIISTLYEDTGEVVLRVRDTGQGMSEGDIVKAMEPFRQLSTSRTGGGTGLGLPLTKALVEANRAAFQIDSTPGQGTMIQITFPSTRVLAE
jgi:PAS domain S-box-containing protein